MRAIFFLMLCCGFSLTACTQSSSKSKQTGKTPHVGGTCEGCEAIYESPVPFEKLSSTDTLPDYFETGPKLVVSGTIYQRDGKTPAPGVVLYVYHTDQGGHYSKRGDETGWGKRHGYIRGWVKTDKNGFYRFYTLRPVSYPGSTIPQHIHPTIKEPGFNEYWIEEYQFEDDPLFKRADQPKSPRGGNGVVKVGTRDGIQYVTRNIILGLNIPGYPEKK